MIVLFQIVFIAAIAEAIICGLMVVVKSVVVIWGLLNCGCRTLKSHTESHRTITATSVADHSAANTYRNNKRAFDNNLVTNDLVSMSGQNDTIYYLASEQEQEREQTEAIRLHEEQSKLAATGIEFGGNNTDLNLNPAAHYGFDESINNNSSWNDSYADSSWDTGYMDSGDSYSYNSCVDPFTGF